MKWEFYKRMNEEEKEEWNWINNNGAEGLMFTSYIFFSLALNCIILFLLGAKDWVAAIGGLFLITSWAGFLIGIILALVASFRGSKLIKRVRTRLNKEEFDRAAEITTIPFISQNDEKAKIQDVIKIEPSTKTFAKRGRKPFKRVEDTNE